LRLFSFVSHGFYLEKEPCNLDTFNKCHVAGQHVIVVQAAFFDGHIVTELKYQKEELNGQTRRSEHASCFSRNCTLRADGTVVLTNTISVTFSPQANYTDWPLPLVGEF
jgi:hypothetical protein